MNDNGYAGLLAVANGWKTRAVAAEAERDALAAHVEDVRAAYISGGQWAERVIAIGRVLNQSPTTSLAHLKAEWDQDELQPIWETLIKVADMLGIDPEKARKAGGKPSAVYAESLARQKLLWQAEAISRYAAERLGGADQELAEIYASKLRRQAEEDKP